MDDDAHSKGVKDNLSQRSTWLRLVYMLVLAVAWVVTEVIFIAVVILQFLAKLFTGHPLKHLTAFGGSLADYMAQIVRFETFVTEDLAFPFVAWPSPANDKPATVSPPQPQEQSTETDEAKPPTDSNTEVEPKKKPRTRRTRKTETPK
jgi:hypothetical protein